jgi:hypothetical protein
MSNRLDQEREARLQPKRIKFAKDMLTELGFVIVSETDTELRIEHKGAIIKFFPYSGWHSGSTIKDGRGFKRLLHQLLHT